MDKIDQKEELDKPHEGEMTFMQHLESLRWHLVRSVIAILAGAVVCFIFSDFIFDEIIFKLKTGDFWTNRMFGKMAEMLDNESLRLNNKHLNIISTEMAGQFSMHLKMSFIGGAVLAFPYLLRETWLFIKPALHDGEKQSATAIIGSGSLLFIIGILFGYYLIAPLSLHFLGGYNISEAITNQIQITSYISTILSTVISGGVVFELPIIVYFLSRLGLVTPETMRKYRKHAIVGLLLLAALITPPDIYSQLIVLLPLILLYEVSIVISKIIQKRKEAEWDDDLDSDEIEV